ncbi:MAG: long-chain-fatty-acid--CoA ligase [bacterium]
MAGGQAELSTRPWVRHYDRHVKPSLDYPQASLPDLLAQSVKTYGGSVALRFMSRGVTYREFDAASNQFAHFLLKRGIGKDHRVVLILPNLPHFPVAFYGILKAGATAVPVNPLYTPKEWAYFLKDSECSAVVTLDLFAEKVQQACDEAGVKTLMVGGPQDYLPFFQRLLYPFVKKDRPAIPTGAVLFTRALAEGKRSRPEVKVAADDLAALIYTGGTTGVSKGAMLTHRNLVANVLQCDAWFPQAQGGRVTMVAVMPFFHSFGLTVGLNFALYMGAEIVMVPRFNVRQILEVIQAQKPPAMFPGTPSIYAAINAYSKAKDYDLSCLWVSISGGAPLPTEVQRKFEEMSKSILVEGFGMTESSPVTHVNPILGKRKAGSIGVPLPDTDSKIVDSEDGSKQMAVGQEGELIIRGPQVMAGYWRKPEETANTLKDGWLFTGDIAKMDDDGFFTVVDRKKDMIIVEGFNVYPREIEEVLFAHPKIKEAAAVGVKDSLKGEVVKVFAVVKENETLTKEEVLNYCREHLAPYKVPKSVEFLEELPKSAINKVLRRELRNRANP